MPLLRGLGTVNILSGRDPVVCILLQKGGIWVEQIIDLKEVGRVLIKKRRNIINITVA